MGVGAMRTVEKKEKRAKKRSFEKKRKAIAAT